MLVRVGLVMEPGEQRKELKRALQTDEAFIISIKPQELPRRGPRESLDLVIMGPGMALAEMKRAIAELMALSEPPELLALIELVGERSMEWQASLLALGCSAVLPTGLPLDRMTEALMAVLERVKQRRADRWMMARREGRARLDDFNARSGVMRQFMDTVHRVVSTDSSLLILGETGVGKEHLARALHADGPRSQGPFVAVNCGALPEGLLESELFGHEKGAFTGAVRSRRGHFELAHGGTLFLDEIGEMPIHLQSKLLRALQERVIQPLGSERQVPVDVRVFAATNRDLAVEIAEKRFRSDLYYRLAVVTLTLPPLRARQDDIPRLATHYLEQYSGRFGRDIDAITPAAMEALKAYDWPGNVRELANVIERAILLCTEDVVDLCDLPDEITGGLQLQLVEPGGSAEDAQLGILPDRLLEMEWKAVRAEVLDALERDYLDAMMSKHGGRVGVVASRAGMDPRSLFDKLRRHNLRKEDYRG